MVELSARTPGRVSAQGAAAVQRGVTTFVELLAAAFFAVFLQFLPALQRIIVAASESSSGCLMDSSTEQEPEKQLKLLAKPKAGWWAVVEVSSGVCRPTCANGVSER
jgi:hypothetical protein